MRIFLDNLSVKLDCYVDKKERGENLRVLAAVLNGVFLPWNSCVGSILVGKKQLCSILF